MLIRPIRKTHIKNYEILETISFNLRTVIYLAKHKDNEDIFVIKEFNRSDVLKNNQTNKLFNLELKINKGLKNNKLVNIVEIIKTKTSFYIVMEYLQYGSLEDLLENNKGKGLPRDLCVNIINSLIDIFKQLREERIFARVLDLDAIYFNPIKRNVIITQLGFYKQVYHINEDMNKARCPYHMVIDSKESLLKFGPDLDLFVLGILYFRLLTGKELFTGSTRDELISDINNKLSDESGAYLDVLGKELKEERGIIRSLIQIDPKKQKGIDFITESKLFKDVASRSDIPHLNNPKEKGKARKNYLNGQCTEQQQQNEYWEQQNLINLRSNIDEGWRKINSISIFEKRVNQELDKIILFFNGLNDKLIEMNNKDAIDLYFLSHNLLVKKIDIVQSSLNSTFVVKNSTKLGEIQRYQRKSIKELFVSVLVKNKAIRTSNQGYFICDYNIKRISVVDKALKIVMERLSECLP